MEATAGEEPRREPHARRPHEYFHLGTSVAEHELERGLATAASAHGLGTAALVGGEPNALPYCALAYALSGIISSVLVAIPVVQVALMSIIGAA